MKYVGMHTQQVQNNLKSVLLLLLFPCILLGVVYVFLVICNSLGVTDPMYGGDTKVNWDYVNYEMLQVLPWVVGIVGVWFLISYLFNTSMIRHATGARPLERRENPRVYNIVENLTMACGMPMPKVNVIDDPMLNAFASGIDEKTYTVTVTTGICQRLTDAELAGVIGHELTHIRNRDTRLLIISIGFAQDKRTSRTGSGGTRGCGTTFHRPSQGIEKQSGRHDGQPLQHPSQHRETYCLSGTILMQHTSEQGWCGAASLSAPAVSE